MKKKKLDKEKIYKFHIFLTFLFFFTLHKNTLLVAAFYLSGLLVFEVWQANDIIQDRNFRKEAIAIVSLHRLSLILPSLIFEIIQMLDGKSLDKLLIIGHPHDVFGWVSNLVLFLASAFHLSWLWVGKGPESLAKVEKMLEILPSDQTPPTTFLFRKILCSLFVFFVLIINWHFQNF